MIEILLRAVMNFATGGDANSDSDDDDDDDDDEGWITPGNIEAMKQATIALTQSEVTDLPVACVTTDYAMQVTFSWDSYTVF